MEVFVCHETLFWTHSLSSLRVSAVLVGVRGSFFSVFRALTIRRAPIDADYGPDNEKTEQSSQLASFIPPDMKRSRSRKLMPWRIRIRAA